MTAYLSTAAAAEHLGVHPETIRRMVARGTLRAFRAGRVLRIPAADLEPHRAAVQHTAPRPRAVRGEFAAIGRRVTDNTRKRGAE